MVADQEQFEEKLSAMNSALVKVQNRLDVLHQEFQRTAAVVQRLKLMQDDTKAAASHREDMLAELQAQMLRIEKLLSAAK